MRKLTMLLAGALALFGATSLSAQNATATVTIPTVLAINLTGNSFDFNPTQTEFDAGVMGATGTSTLSTRGNVPHDIDITAGTNTFGYSGTYTDPAKAASDLEWSTGSGWTGLSTTAAPVVQGLSRGVNANAATVSYQLLLSYDNDVPGTYTLNFTYTVVAN